MLRRWRDRRALRCKRRSEPTASHPYALLRAGFPYYTTLGMRRVTTFCMDLAIGDEGRLFVLCRDDGVGGNSIREYQLGRRRPWHHRQQRHG